MTEQAKEQPLFGAMVEKYAMGRSTGFQVKNWQKRYLAIFPTKIAYFSDELACRKGSKPKFESAIKNFSLCIMQATEKDHEEAKGPLLFILRVWDGGVFDILVRPPNPDQKAQFMAAIRQATAEVKGFQMVGDSDVLGGEEEDNFFGDEEEEKPKPTKKKPNPKKVVEPVEVDELDTGSDGFEAADDDI